MSMIRLFVAFVIISAGLSCDPIPQAGPNCHKEILIRNISSETKFATLLPGSFEGIPCRNTPTRVEPNETLEYSLRPCWEEEINRDIYAGQVSIFIVDSLPLETVAECDSIKLDQSITSEISLDLEELQQLNFTVDIN